MFISLSLLYLTHLLALCLSKFFTWATSDVCFDSLSICLFVFLSISLTYTSSCFVSFCIFYMGNNVGVLWGVTHLADAPSSKIHALVFQQKMSYRKHVFVKVVSPLKVLQWGSKYRTSPELFFFLLSSCQMVHNLKVILIYCGSNVELCGCVWNI